MLPPLRPALDPLAERTAIDAIEAQRAAYRRYAQAVDAHSQAVGTGDADRAVAAADTVADGADALDAGARALRPHLDRVRAHRSPEQQEDVQRRLAMLASDGDRAQTAIHNLTAQLDAWRVAYGRQLGAASLTPGASGRSTTDGTGGVAASGGGSDVPVDVLGASRAHDHGVYGPRGQAGATQRAPTLLNRRG